ncbi:hypothetical protein F5888DRAFT_1799977 [Russula emetica]|nr:hypothetical protein F5888DRAFT_1799977 [Russula emetica]
MRHGARDVSGVSSSAGSVVSASTPSGTSSDPSQTQLHTSSDSLFGICGVVGTFLLAIIIWRIRSIYKRRNARAAITARARYSYMYGIKEKPAFISFADATDDDSPRKSAVLNTAPSDPSARWKPQIRGVTLRSGVTVPPIAVTHPERSPKVQDEFPPTPNSGPSVSPLLSPPPAYRILGLHTIPLPSSPQESEPADIPPPTPMHRSPRRTVSTPVRESFDLPPVPTPSPRSASFQHITDTTLASTPRASLASLSTSKSSLPRLMVVTTSFESTRPDELRLRTGETLRLIREFDDEWCLVQRVGRLTAERGVVPRFCLSERPRVVKSYVRLSNSIFNNVRRK